MATDQKALYQLALQSLANASGAIIQDLKQGFTASPTGNDEEAPWKGHTAYVEWTPDQKKFYAYEKGHPTAMPIGCYNTVTCKATAYKDHSHRGKQTEENHPS